MTTAKAVVIDGNRLEVYFNNKRHVLELGFDIYERIAEIEAGDTIIGKCAACGAIVPLFEVEGGVWVCRTCAPGARKVMAVSSRV